MRLQALTVVIMSSILLASPAQAETALQKHVNFFDQDLDRQITRSETQVGLEDLGIEGFSDLCRTVEREATELLLETFISAIIGLVIVLGSTGQMGETDRGQMGEKDRAKRNLQQNTKPRHKLQKSDRELKNRLQRNTRSNPIRCKHFFKDGPDLRCSNTHLNKMYCDEHIEKLESRTK